MIPEEPKSTGKKNAKKDLLKLEKPLYQLKRNEDGKVESIIAKLMEKKDKPQIGIIPRSHLFDQLDKFIPILKQSNNELSKQEVQPQLKFDAKLEVVQDSSSSSEDEDDEMREEERQMEVEQEKPSILESVDEFQFNILTYPYLNPKDEASVQTKNEEEKLASKLKKVVELDSKQKDGEVNHLEQMQ